MNVNEIFPVADLRQMIDDKYVTERPHNMDPSLRIYNYTPKAAVERIWNPVTLNCRGLVLRNEEVVARPFPKFFNMGEVETIPDGPIWVSEKADGSLGIGYIGPEGVSIATRGSFHSDQATWATAWLKKKENEHLRLEILAAIDRGITPLFEIVYPENRIVLDYQGFEGLIFLTGFSIDEASDRRIPWSGRSADFFMMEKFDVEILAEMERPNMEGFVLLFEDGTRLKYKFEEYIRLHRIVTGVTERTVWDYLSSNRSIDQLAEFVPDEFFNWMKGVASNLNKKFTEIEKECFADYTATNITRSRADVAADLKKTRHPAIMFRMLDGKIYSDIIWKMIYPPATAKVIADD